MQYSPATTRPVPLRRYAQRFSSTRRGARLARLMGTQQLADWGIPHGSDAGHTAALLISELATNAFLHAPPAGDHQGRDFQLRLHLTDSTELRIEVTDVYAERGVPGVPGRPGPDSDNGRGLLLVDTLARTWGVGYFPPAGKTVWCDLDL